jgi:CubicO group peptidase (beta-lactamase class C family)
LDVSRRRFLLGTAAGVASAPLIAAQVGAATPTPSWFGGALRRSDDPAVGGTFHPRFQGVADEFSRNFAERGEVGASLCVIADGKTVVDLWGGIAKKDTGAAWQEDTLSQIWSSTKGATSLCAHILIDRKLLDLVAPVTTYWPEYGQNGKGGTTVAMMLAHQAGLPALREKVPAGAFYDWEYMTTALAAEAPFWEPGTRNGYHALTFGFLVGELVRRVSGKSLGAFFRDEVATPLGLDFWIGLPESEEPRVAPNLFPGAPPPGEALSIFLLKAITEPTSIPALSFFNTGGYTDPGESDTRAAHAAEIGASGGITNGRGLAQMYAPLAGMGRTQLLSDDARRRMARVASATGQDATGFIPTRFALGYVKSMDNRAQPPGQQDSVILGEAAFGHSGFGGSIGFADPEAGFSLGYTMNQMGLGTALNPRGQALVDAVYAALGYESNASGSWASGVRRRGRHGRR